MRFGFLWTGFYRVTGPDLLRVGPYQGTLGCLDIAFGRGVCGTAAAERRTIIVADVSKFPGHISCDARAKSEIVVPVMNAKARSSLCSTLIQRSADDSMTRTRAAWNALSAGLPAKAVVDSHAPRI